MIVCVNICWTTVLIIINVLADYFNFNNMSHFK